jgi:pectate lyase
MSLKLSLSLILALLVVATSLMLTLKESHARATTVAAFPGAEGFGAQTIGGRGGKVIEVTNLNDSGPGSLRAAVQTSGPRIVVFRLGGIINLSTPLVVTNPFITIAGQTAPGGGILVKGFSGIRINTHDVVVRYVRFRLTGDGSPGSGQVNIGIGNGAYNVIVDHCSTSWSLDENMQIWKKPQSGAPDLKNITVQRCFIAEGLAGHSTGLLFGGEANYGVSPPMEEYLKVYNLSIHHNLFAHNSLRNPRGRSAGGSVTNNTVYNWDGRVSESDAKNRVDYINNYFKPGPMSGDTYLWHEKSDPTKGWNFPDPSIYVSGNLVEGKFTNPSADNWQLIVDANSPTHGGPLPNSFRRFQALPAAAFPVTIQPAVTAYASVMADVGANARLDCQGNWVPNSDAVDQRVLADVKNGTGWSKSLPASPQEAGGFPKIAKGIPCQDTDHDGMPDEWESLHGFNTTDGSDGSKDADSDGYTNVEEYLNGTKPQ